MPLSVTPGSVVCGSAKRLGQSSPIRPLLTLPCNKSLGGLKLGGTRVRSMAHNCRLLIKAAGSLAAAPCESYWVPAACASPPHACRVRALTVSYAPPVPGPPPQTATRALIGLHTVMRDEWPLVPFCGLCGFELADPECESYGGV